MGTADRPGLAAGTNVGRYIVLDVAGQGAFGAVYRAYDPELDRPVAVKLIDERADDDRATRRSVLAEARSLAKLRHPNIVTVFDVGEHEGRVFVAMEYIAGSDLGAWLEAENRPWSAVARVMAKAARGLAAAHAAGIVHRDFKPSNVLVDDAAEPFVADFGLARAVGRGEGLVLGLDGDGDTGPVLPPGTPPYLAPELYDGVAADARSDLFAYCVTLWQAAYGAYPWPVDDEAALLVAKRRDEVTPPKGASVPRAIDVLLRAGLRLDPAERPSDLTPFIAALDPAGGRRWWGVATVAGLAAVAGGAFAMRDRDPCSEVASVLSQTWNDGTRESTRAAIVASGAPSGEETAHRVTTNIDAWADRWTAQRNEVCRATHVERTQSPATLDRRMICLDRERAQMQQLVALVGEGDVDVVGRAASAVAKLGLACGRAALVGEAEPDGEEGRALRADLDRAQVLETLAKYGEGLALADEVERRAEALSAERIAAEATYRRARLLDRTGDIKASLAAYERAHFESEAKRFDEIAAKAGLGVMFENAAVLNKADVALAWEPHVRASVRRLQGDPKMEATLADSVGIAQLYAGQVEDSLSSHLEALRMREGYDNEGLDTVSTLQNLGIVYEEMHRYDDAIAQHERAMKIVSRLVGEHHPHAARILDNLGTTLLRKGEIDGATENFERALAIRRDAFPPRHSVIAMTIVHLGHANLRRGKAEEARAAFDEALSIFLEMGDPQSRDVLISHEALAHAHRELGEPAEAKAHARKALAGLETLLPADHPELVALREIVDSDHAAP